VRRVSACSQALAAAITRLAELFTVHPSGVQ